MWTIKTKILYILYQVMSSWLPETRHFPLGGKFRTFWARRICRFVGSEVNIERGAKFTPQLEIGHGSGVGIHCEINGDVTIGENVMMGPEVVIYTSNHNFSDIDKPICAKGLWKRSLFLLEAMYG